MSKTTNDGGPAFPTGELFDCGKVVAYMEQGMSLRDYLAAHAPPVPAVAYEGYLDCLRTNEAESMQIPWNDHILKCLAVQEARWRWHFADELLTIRERTYVPLSEPPQ
jgi:hypothetical protein